MASQNTSGTALVFVMPSVYVQKLLVLPQFVWLCGQDTDGSTSIMGVSNPGYGEYTIYANISRIKYYLGPLEEIS